MITKRFTGKGLFEISVETEVDRKNFDAFMKHQCKFSGAYSGAIGGGNKYSFTKVEGNLEVKMACYCSHEQDVNAQDSREKMLFQQSAFVNPEKYQEFRDHLCGKLDESYAFTPTSVGTGIVAHCSCGVEVNITDYDWW